MDSSYLRMTKHIALYKFILPIIYYLLLISYDIYDSFFPCQQVRELTLKYKSEFLQSFLAILLLFIRRHLIEDDLPSLSKEWSRPVEDIRDIRRGTRDDEVVLPLLSRVFRKIFRTCLDCSDVCESELLYEVIHCFHLFSYRIQKCYLYIW